jgi:hypothetical protein
LLVIHSALLSLKRETEHAGERTSVSVFTTRNGDSSEGQKPFCAIHFVCVIIRVMKVALEIGYSDWPIVNACESCVRENKTFLPIPLLVIFPVSRKRNIVDLEVLNCLQASLTVIKSDVMEEVGVCSESAAVTSSRMILRRASVEITTSSDMVQGL